MPETVPNRNGTRCQAVGKLVYLLPDIAGSIQSSFTFGITGVLFAESGLSFLGYGVQPPPPVGAAYCGRRSTIRFPTGI